MTEGFSGSAQVLGLKELNDALKRLPERVARNVLRGATNAGASVIRAEAKQREHDCSTGAAGQHLTKGSLFTGPA